MNQSPMVLVIRAYEENDAPFTGARKIGHLIFYGTSVASANHRYDPSAARPRKSIESQIHEWYPRRRLGRLRHAAANADPADHSLSTP
jgi:hypothetical protein